MEFGDCRYFGNRDGLDIYIPEKKLIFENKKEKIKIFHVGQRNNLPTRNMFLIGETGSGKTTMLQTIYNIFRGINFEDDYRMSLFEEEDGCHGKGAYESQTEFITGYLFYAQSFMKNRKFNIMIIDSPGLYDTRGTETRKSIINQMSEFLKHESHGVDDLSCIGYVVKATITRELEYFKETIQDSLKLFGKDMEAITFILKTFACDSDTSIMGIFRSYGLSTQNEFDFDNGILYKPNKVGVADQQGKTTTKKIMRSRSEKWDDVSQTCEELFISLFEVKPVCMRLTRKLMQEKIYLERNKMNLIEQVSSVLMNLIAARKNQKMLKEFDECMDANKNWDGVETKINRERVAVKSSARWYMFFPHVHNCEECDKTCSDICYAFRGCPKLTPTCSICGCSKNDHTRSETLIKMHLTEERVTKRDIKAKFDNAKNLKGQLTERMDKMNKEVEKSKGSIARMINIMVLQTERLNDICKGNYYQSAEELTEELIDQTVKNDPVLLSYMDEDIHNFITSLKNEVEVTNINKETWKADLEEVMKEFEESESKNRLSTNRKRKL